MEDKRALPRVPEFDGLRGFLAVWVAFTHILCWAGYAALAVPRAFEQFWPDFIFAGPAVEVFMILSGFAVAFLLHVKRPAYREFMVGRFLRLYPVYFVCLLAGLVAIYITPFVLVHAPWHDTVYFDWVGNISRSERKNLLLHLLAHGSLLHGLLPRQWLSDSTGALLPPAWSITLEWQFYLVAPLVVLLCRSGGGVILLSLIAFVAMEFETAWTNPHLAFFPAQLPLFVIGVASFHAYRWIQTAPGRAVAQTYLPIAGLLAFSLLVPWHSPALMLWALVCGGVISQGNGFFGRTLAGVRYVLMHPLLQFLGRLSYPIYLIHWPIIIGCTALLLWLKPAATSLEAALWNVALGGPLILLSSWLLHRLVEQPCMRLRRKPAFDTTNGSPCGGARGTLKGYDSTQTCPLARSRNPRASRSRTPPPPPGVPPAGSGSP